MTGNVQSDICDNISVIIICSTASFANLLLLIQVLLIPLWTHSKHYHKFEINLKIVSQEVKDWYLRGVFCFYQRYWGISLSSWRWMFRIKLFVWVSFIIMGGFSLNFIKTTFILDGHLNWYALKWTLLALSFAVLSETLSLLSLLNKLLINVVIQVSCGLDTLALLDQNACILKQLSTQYLRLIFHS